MGKFQGNIGNRIKELREREGMTQAEFGEILEIAQQYVASLETGYRTPGLALLFVMANRFDVPEKWLKEGKGKLPKRAAYLTV